MRTINHGVVDPKQSGEEQRKELVEEHRTEQIWEFSGFMVVGNSAEREGDQTKKKIHFKDKNEILPSGTIGTIKTEVQTSRTPLSLPLGFSQLLLFSFVIHCYFLQVIPCDVTH